MFATNRASQESDVEDSCAATPRETELARLRLWLAFGTILYTPVILGSLARCAYWELRQFMSWMKGLPQGVKPTWERLISDAPSVFYSGVAGGIVGLLLAAVGFALLLKLLGRQNWPPKKVVLALSTLPLFLTVLGAGLSLSSGTVIGTALILPLMLGFSLAFVPLEVGLLAAALASLGLRQLRQGPKLVEAAELPAAAADYLDQFEADALDAGLTPLGDFSYLPHWKKYRRYWMAPNGAYFVDATWVSLGQTTMQAIGVCSATSDGHYFETADQPPPSSTKQADPSESITHVTHLPGAPLAELIETHIEQVAGWVAQAGCRPLEFAAADLHSFTNYGIAAYMRESQNDFLWLGNPYAGQPLPPLPGRPWQPEEEPSAATPVRQ